jgi:uncharacterized membrane protein
LTKTILNKFYDLVDDSKVDSGVTGKVRVVHIPAFQFIEILGILKLNAFYMSICHGDDDVCP